MCKPWRASLWEGQDVPATGHRGCTAPYLPVEGDNKILVHWVHGLSEGWIGPSDILFGRLTKQSLT